MGVLYIIERDAWSQLLASKKEITLLGCPRPIVETGVGRNSTA
jgi:hypothetical protein